MEVAITADNIHVPDMWLDAVGTSNWYYIWNNTGELENSSYFLWARSYDGYNYSDPKNVYVTLKTEKVEVTNYNIVTLDWTETEELGEGFNYTEDAYFYKVSGTIKNIAYEHINQVNIGVHFYDENNNFIHIELAYVGSLEILESKGFSVTYSRFEEDFEHADHVTFSFGYNEEPVRIA